VDGDNRFDVDGEGRELAGGLPEFFDAVAASVPGFTLHVLGRGKGINQDVVVAPAGHPALRLLLETTRASYRRGQKELTGSLERMTQRFAGQANLPMRFTLVRRTGWAHHDALKMLGIGLEDPRLVRANRAIAYLSGLSWAPQGDPVPGARRRSESLDDAAVVDVAVRVVSTLARHLRTRDGDLHLTEVAPVVATLPAPDAVWIAVLTLLAELSAAGVVPQLASVTEARLTDLGAADPVVLPPEAEALIDRTRTNHAWLGSGLVTSGAPAWLMDEVVAPARWRERPLTAPERMVQLRARVETVHGRGGTVVGLWLRDPRPAPDASRGPAVRPDVGVVPAGYIGIWAGHRCGEAFAGDLRVRADDLAVLLLETGLAGSPLFLVSTTATAGGLDRFAQELGGLARQPVVVVDGTERPV
jgi:hypothetical protein